jgi:hypothetical protein
MRSLPLLALAFFLAAVGLASGNVAAILSAFVLALVYWAERPWST